MRQIALLFSILAACSSLMGQDLIILFSGEKIEAKIAEVSETEVRYKKWSNLSGPIWVKKTSEIERIKYQKDRLLKQPTFVQGEQWDFRACGSSSKQKSKKGRCVSGNEIVSQIDIFYANSNCDKIRPYVDGLPSCVSRDCIHQYYYEQFLHSCDEENEYGVIRYGTTYLKTGGTAELPTVLPMVAKMQAVQSNESEVENLIKEFERYSEANDDLFDGDIEQLRQESYALLHPYHLEDEIKGKWVVVEAKRGPYDKDNPIILDVDDVSRYNGIQLIPSAYHGSFIKHSDKWQIDLRDQLSFSQGIIFDAPNQLVITRFASEYIKDRSGNEDFARTGIEEMRNTRADMIGTIASSNASFEDKIMYSGATILATSLIEGLLKSSTISSKSVEAYTFAMMPRTQVTLDAAFSYVSGKNVNGVVVKDEKELNQRRLLVKWEESDSVYFISAKGDPISLDPLAKNDPLFKDYNKIHKRASTTKWAVGLSTGVASACLCYYGINGAIRNFGNDSKKGIIDLVIGVGSPFFVFCIPYAIVSTSIENKAKDSYSKINIKNKNKLIRKAEKAEKKLSLAPCYDPETNAVGASVNLNF